MAIMSLISAKDSSSTCYAFQAVLSKGYVNSRSPKYEKICTEGDRLALGLIPGDTELMIEMLRAKETQCFVKLDPE
ncbi:hypothetical protein GRJ2_001399200 [Grus japonensis]|uniref:Uncharacterized protein n=1 Tax=Grus japonensis TaxID=30415 RepID=A0ABC9WX14_GRUJA